MARAAARSGPSSRRLENGRIEFLFAEIFFFIGAKGDKKNPARQGGGIQRNSPRRNQMKAGDAKETANHVNANSNALT